MERLRSRMARTVSTGWPGISPWRAPGWRRRRDSRGSAPATSSASSGTTYGKAAPGRAGQVGARQRPQSGCMAIANRLLCDIGTVSTTSRLRNATSQQPWVTRSPCEKFHPGCRRETDLHVSTGTSDELTSTVTTRDRDPRASAPTHASQFRRPHPH